MCLKINPYPCYTRNSSKQFLLIILICDEFFIALTLLIRCLEILQIKGTIQIKEMLQIGRNSAHFSKQAF